MGTKNVLPYQENKKEIEPHRPKKKHKKGT
jgi:hypothetical protein